MYVVGIGASAGGLGALRKMFDNVYTNTNMAFVIIQHLSPDFKSLMSELLAKNTSLKIDTVREGMIIEPNHIYLNSKNHDLSIKNGKFKLSDRPLAGLHFPIDHFFHSLGSEYRNKAIGIVVSGTGTDGSRGILTINNCGGMVLAQDPETAEFDGMPLAALATRVVDKELKLEEIGGFLHGYAHTGSIPQEDNEVEFHTNDDVYNEILKIVNHLSGVDFEKYKKTTLERRIERRMAVNTINTLHGYLNLLKKHPKEVDRLYSEFLIGVTEFFRDEKDFEILENEVIPRLFKSKEPGSVIRIWDIGCSTGEEVYSVAMMMEKYRKRHGATTQFKIFATDIDGTALQKASKGSFAVNAVSKIDPATLSLNFREVGGRFQIKPTLRSKIIFSKHNLLENPPFANIDLVVCRNVLIYFKPSAQEIALKTFHHALQKGGFLFTGPSESIKPIEKSFEPVTPNHHLYRCVEKPKYKKLPAYISTRFNEKITQTLESNSNVLKDPFMLALLDQFAPDCIFIGQNYDVLYAHGNVDDYLSIPRRKIEFNFFNMINNDHQNTLKAAINKTIKTGKSVIYKNFPLKKEGKKAIPVSIKFSSLEIKTHNSPVILVEFIKTSPETSPNEVIPEEIIPNNIDAYQITALELELKETKEMLSVIVEELETTNEELQAANEELLASNEEMQGTNEELQSVNEELQTVNSELQDKIIELTNLTNDMDNLMASTDIGTIFVDDQLLIRKFTPSIKNYFHLDDNDLGRSIHHFTAHFELDRLFNDIKQVITTGKKIEHEIQNQDGSHHLLRISKFKTHERNTPTKKGAILSFVNISELKKTEQQLIKKSELLERSNRDLEQYAYVASHDLQEPLRTVISFVDVFKRHYKEELDSKSTKFLDVISTSSQRMQEMVTALLEFSRIGREKKLTQIDCNKVLDEILTDMNAIIQESNAVIEAESLPEIWGYENEMRLLLQNLISNSIKYRNPDVSPHIQVKAKKKKLFWEFAVQDNGIGIDPKFNDKIFVIFQRLHARDKYDGTGIGLAHCKKIVELHRGTIWYDGKEGHGTTFYFTIANNLKKE